MDDRDRPRPDEATDDDITKAPGDILGLSRVPRDGSLSTEDTVRNREEREGDDAPTASTDDDEPHVGTRDVSHGTTGGTGPDTGGSGVLRRGSGATGTDIGS